MGHTARSSGKQRRSKRGSLVVLMGWLGLFAVAAAQTAVMLPPSVTPLPALAGLGFPVGAVLLLAGCYTAWRQRRWKAGALMLVALVMTAPLFRATWGCAGCGTQEGAGPEFAVVSWNVRLYDHYGWVGGESETGRSDVRKGIMAAIEDAAPDVLCVQEHFELTDRAAFPVVQPLNAAVGRGAPAYSHVVIARSKKDRRFGLATWSKWPIVGRSSIAFGTRNNNVCAITDVDWDGDTVRIFNAHFSSLRFEEEDYAALEEGVPNAEGRERIWGAHALSVCKPGGPGHTGHGSCRVESASGGVVRGLQRYAHQLGPGPLSRRVARQPRCALPQHGWHMARTASGGADRPHTGGRGLERAIARNGRRRPQ